MMEKQGKANWKKALSVAMAATMTLTAGTTCSVFADETSDKELSRVTVYPANATVASGVVGGFKGDILADYGVEAEIWAYSEERTNAILSSGDLPDVMVIPTDKLDVMIESGMLLQLDDYMDQLDKVTGSSMIMTAVNYVKEYRSNGTGNLYCLPLEVGEAQKDVETGRNALRLNWPIYEKIGAPEIEDVWGLIPVMKQMLEASPESDTGEKCYGTFLNSGSDASYWGCMQMYFKWFGYEPTELPYLLEADMVNGKYDSILSTDSKYYEGLKWYNAVYQEGLMDPDSINNDRATQKAKVEKGHAAMVPSGTTPGWANTYLQYYLPETNIYVEHYTQPYGDSAYVIGISADSKNVEGALAFLNALADPDVLLQIHCGPEGDAWYVEDGVAYLSDKAIECQKNSETYVLEDGESLDNWGMNFITGGGYLTSYVDKDGDTVGTGFGSWKEIIALSQDNENFKNWQKTTGGYVNWTELLEANNAYCLNSDLDYLSNFAAAPDDMMQLTIDAIRDTVVNASWKMVYAESDEKFEEIWDEMVSDCEALGAQDIIDWRLGELEAAKEKRDALSAESAE